MSSPARFIPNAEAKDRIGKQIKTLAEISKAAREQKSLAVRNIYVVKQGPPRELTVGFRGPYPAAFVINRIGTDILRMLDAGVFIYKPKPAKRGGIKKGFKP